MTQTNPLIVALLLFFQVSVCAFADAPGDDYGLATKYYQQARWNEAAESFSEFLDKYPQHEKAPLALFYRGEALVQSQEYAAAFESFSRFLKDNGAHRLSRQALYRSGEMAHLSGKRAEARHALSGFCEKYPNDPIRAYALPYLGEIELRDGKYSDAEARYRDAINTFPNGPLIDACRFGMGRSLESQGRIDDALRFYEYLASKDGSQLADDAQLQIGLVQYNRQQFAKAIEQFRGFLEQRNQSSLRADAMYWLGMSHYSNGEWKKSADVFAAMLPVIADHELAPAVHFACGESRRKLSDLEQAQSHFRAVLDKWPKSEWGDDSAEALVQLAFNDERHEDVDTLSAEFDGQFANSPLRPIVQQTFGRSLLKRDKFPQAIVIFDELAKLANETDTIGSSSIHYLLALAYAGDQKFENALNAISKTVPDNNNQEFTANVSLALATIHFALENYREASDAQKKYLAIMPNGPDATKCRGELVVALTKQKQFSDAIKIVHQLERESSKYPQWLATVHFVAEAAYAGGEGEIAGELFKKLTAEGNPPEYVQKGLYGLAWLRNDAKNSQQSADAFRRLLDRFPNSSVAPEAAVMRARSLQESGKLDDASDAYLFLIDEYPDSDYVPEALLAAARIQANSKHSNGKIRAAELFQKFESQFSNNDELDGALYDLAWVLLDLQRDREAQNVFARIHKNFPESTYWGDVTYRLAEQAAKSGDVEEAKSLTDALIDAKVSTEIQCHALYLSGQLAADEGNWERVTRSMGEIVTQHPESSLAVPAEYWVGESLYRVGHLEDAQKQFLALSDKTADRNDAWLAMVPLRLSQIDAKNRKWQPSLVIAQGIAARFPNFRQQFEADYVIGRCLASQAKFTEAREYYEKVVRSPHGGKTETAAMAQWMIGETYFHQKKFDDAIQSYHRVETLYEFSQWQAAALLQAGKCYEKKGDLKSAVKVYAELLKHYAESASSKEASQRLRFVKEQLTTVAG